VNPRRLAASVAANVALLTIAVGLPITLAFSFGSPLPAGLPSWAQFSDAITQGDIGDRTLLKVIAAVIWLAWLHVAVSVAGEVVATVRGRSMPRVPLSSPALQLNVGRLVATAALLFSTVHQPGTRSLEPLPRAVLAAHLQAPAAAAPAPAVGADVEAEPSTTEWVVAPRETLWGIAARVLGDGRAYTQLFELNRGRPQADGTPFTEPGRLQPGTRLLVPNPSTVATGGRHHVTAGESLSSIARVELNDATRWPELYEANHDVAQADGERLTDPNLIRPGWVIDLPASNDAPAAPTVLPPPPLPSAPAVVEPTQPAQSQSAPTARAANVEDEGSSPSLAEQVGWAGGAVLSAAVLTLLARRRRRTTRGLGHLRRPSRRAADLALALRTTAASDLVGRARATLQQLAHDLDRQHTDPATPQLIEVGDAQLEVLWTEPLLPVVGQWATTNGGWSWTNPLVDTAQRHELDPIWPVLVSLGERDGNPVFANLETFGALSLDGARAADIMHALAVELDAAVLADATVMSCGLSYDHLERVHPVTLADAAGWARQRADAAPTQATPARGAPRPTPHRPLVVLVGDVDADEPAYRELLDSARPGSGVVLVLLDPPHAVGEWRLHCTDTTAILEPLGLALTARPLDAQGAALVDELIDDTDPADANDEDLLGEDRLPEPITAAWQADDTKATAHDLDDGHEDAAEVEVRLFGQVEVDGAAGKLTPGELELLVYLLCHPQGTSADLIRTALWPEGRSLKTLHNRMSELRTKLGLDTSGKALLPHSSDDRYRLSPHVHSDWHRLLARIEHADAAPSGEAMDLLRGGLELVTGSPFVATSGYSWAFSEGIATEMVEVVKHAARRLAELCLDAGDPTGAVWAARRGQLVTSPADSQQLTLIAMNAQRELGNPAAAIEAYRELLADLDDLDPELEPDPMVEVAYKAIKRAKAS
jgi:hypothetical protein